MEILRLVADTCACDPESDFHTQGTGTAPLWPSFCLVSVREGLYLGAVRRELLERRIGEVEEDLGVIEALDEAI